MKKILQIIIGISSITAYGQVSDSVDLNPGYFNSSYYSFENGEVSNTNNQNWDLSFDLSSWGSTIRLNRKNCTLYVAPFDTSNWVSLDTSGITSWDQHINGYDYWNEGAFDKAADQSDPFDLGWGTYNSITHHIIGSRIFVLSYTSGDTKKLIIQSLANGMYTFKFANLDNSNETIQTITKSDYTDKNFVYFNLITNQVIDREPATTSWDVEFTNYILELAPGYFGGVTSVLQNKNTYVSRISNVPSTISSYDTWDTTISTIGYDWKSFNMATFQYEIVDSLTYFVQSANGNIWKIIFTDFEGSSTGKIHFTKQQVEFAAIVESALDEVNIYPNPSNSFLAIENKLKILDITLINTKGEIVYSVDNLNVFSKSFNTNSFENGFYFLTVKTSNNQNSTHKIIIQH